MKSALIYLAFLFAVLSTAQAAPAPKGVEAQIRCETADAKGQSDVELQLTFTLDPENPPTISKGEILELNVKLARPGKQTSALIADASMFSAAREFGWWPESNGVVFEVIDPVQTTPVRRTVKLYLPTTDLARYLKSGNWGQPLLITTKGTTLVENDDDGTVMYANSGTCSVHAHALPAEK